MKQNTCSKERPQKIYDKVKIRVGKPIVSQIQAFQSASCEFTRTLIPNPSISGFDGNYEYLKYKVHSRKPYTRVLPCLHKKNTVTWYPLSANVCVHNYKVNCTGIKKPWDIWDYVIPKHYIPFADGNREPPLPDIGVAHREALEFFASGCQPLEVNLAVNLTEVGEIFDMLKNIVSAFNTLKQVYQKGRFPFSWKSFVRRLSSGNIDVAWDATGVVASAYLQYCFAIAPLIADVKKCKTALDEVNSRVEWFLNNNQKPVPVRFTKNLSSAVSTRPVTFPSTDGGWTDNFITQYTAKYSAFALATYDVSGLTKDQVRYKLLKRYLGFSDPLTFLYEKIPFSFVIDWIVNVGEYIATFDSEIMFPYVLAMSGWSLYVKSTHAYAAQHRSSYYTPTHAFQGIYAVDEREWYERHPEIPVTFQGLNLSPPTVKQLSLALALGRSFFHK